MAPIFLAALGLLLAPAFAAPQAPPTCVDNASDDMTYIATNAHFKIECETDYWGNDIAAPKQPTFEACIVACDALPNCKAVSYVGDNCYMKGKIAETPTVQGNCWTARHFFGGEEGAPAPTEEDPEEEEPVEQDPAPFSCIDKKDDGALYRTTKGVFKVECGMDYGGNDIGAANVESFELCIDKCSETASCVNVAYVWGACYMKNKNGDASAAGHVWTATLQIDTTTPETPDTPTETGTPTTPVVPLTCEGKKDDKKQYGAPSGGLYLIECGVDYAGGDLSAAVVASFEECIEACDKNIQCVDVSFVHGSCYLKKELVLPAVEAGHVWTAKVLKAAKDVFAFPTATPQDIKDGSEEMFDGPFVDEPAPTATLAPASPPGIDMGGLGVLTPDEKAKIWYNGEDSENAEGGATTVRLTIDYQYPSIVLDYSIYIKDVTCGADGLTGRFDTTETLTPYLYALSSWPQTSKVILITSAASCSPGQGQNAFFLAESISFNDGAKTFKAVGAAAELADLYTNMDIDFGTIVPDEPKDVAFDGAAACGSPDQAVLNGLPALACGADFDKRLDAHLTFYSDEIKDNEQILEAISGQTDLIVFNPKQKRWFSWIKKAIAVVVKAVVQVVKAVAIAVVKTVAVIVQKAVAVVVSVAKKVVAISVAIAVNAVKLIVFVVTGNYSNKLTLPFNLGPSNAMKTESPWGPAVKVYTFRRGAQDEKWSAESTALDKLTGLIGIEEEPTPGVEMWCVNCGINGKVVAEGSISATPLSGLTKGKIGVSGNLYAGLYLGVNAFAKWEKTFEKEFLRKNLAGWSIPGIVSLGPELVLALEATIGVQAEGQLITGASLTWPHFEATLDFVDRTKSTRSGWTPVVDSKFQAHGSLEATAALGLPIKLEFGINILNGKIKKSVGLSDTPAITATAEFSIDIGTDTNDIGTEDCYGIGWDIKLTNEVKLEITDGPEFVLHQWASPALAEGCIGWPKPGEPEAPTTTTPPEPVQTGLRCPAAGGTTFTDSSSSWDIRCGVDYPFNDMAQNNSPDFESCIASCGRTNGCVGVTWIRSGPSAALTAAGSHSCYLKSAWGAPRNSATNPWAGPPLDTAVIQETGLKCPSAHGTTYTDASNSYEVQCNIDYPFQDMASNNSPDIESCFSSCGATDGCVGATFITGGPAAANAVGHDSCYLKYAWGPVRNSAVFPWHGPLLVTGRIMSPFRIHSVMYSDRDITAQAINSWVQGNRIVINTHGLYNLNGDPWVGAAKSISMLYSYGAEERIWNARDNLGTIIIRPGPVSNHAYSSLVPDYPQTWGVHWLKIVGVNYGLAHITNIGVINSMYQHAANRWNWPFTNTAFAADAWPGTVKTGVVWYRDTYSPEGQGRGDLYVMTAREGNVGGWWRPVAKRSVEWSKPRLTGRDEDLYNQTREALLAGNGTKWSNETRLSNETTSDEAAPLLAPIALYPNTTVTANTTGSASNTTVLEAAPFANTTLPANVTAPFLNTTESLPANVTFPGTNTTLPLKATTEDATFVPVTILDSTSILKLNPGKNGNLFLSDPEDTTDISALTGSTFVAASSTTETIVFGDDSDRLLHYYPSTISSLGVSRLRLAAVEDIPKGAKLLSLAEFTGTDGEKMLIGVDPQGNYFFLMLCSIQGQLNKVFLVKDIDTAPVILESEASKFTVTGGKASDCVPLAMVVNSKGAPIEDKLAKKWNA